MTFLSSFPQANSKERTKIYLLNCSLFFFTTFYQSCFFSFRKEVSELGRSDSISFHNLTAFKCFGQYSLTASGRVSTETSIASVQQLKSKRRPPCYSGSQTAAGNQEKCVQASELVRPEAAVISDQSAAREEQKYVFISGCRRGTHPAPQKKTLSVSVKMNIKITQGVNSG